MHNSSIIPFAKTSRKRKEEKRLAFSFKAFCWHIFLIGLMLFHDKGWLFSGTKKHFSFFMCIHYTDLHGGHRSDRGFFLCVSFLLLRPEENYVRMVKDAFMGNEQDEKWAPSQIRPFVCFLGLFLEKKSYSQNVTARVIKSIFLTK